MMRKVLLAVIILLLLLGVAGCGGNGDNQVRPTPISAPGDTQEGGGAGEEGGGVGQPEGAIPSRPVVHQPGSIKPYHKT